jgi:hypothetical protein
MPPIQVKLALTLKQAIEDEAKKLSRSEQNKVTEGEVVHRAWECYQREQRNTSIIAVTSGKKSINLPPDMLRVVESLDRLRSSADQQDQDAYRLLLDTLAFVDKMRAGRVA